MHEFKKNEYLIQLLIIYYSFINNKEYREWMNNIEMTKKEIQNIQSVSMNGLYGNQLMDK